MTVRRKTCAIIPHCCRNHTHTVFEKRPIFNEEIRPQISRNQFMVCFREEKPK